jgi:hypothetical protein
MVAKILDLELIDVAGLAHLHDALRKRLFERERHLAAGGRPVDEIDREIFVSNRAGDAIGLRRLRDGEAGKTGEHKRRH